MVPFRMRKARGIIVIKYIINQEEHHRTKSFKEEYLKMLTDFDVVYQDKYLFEFYD